jgi:hypothetical protein
MKNTLVLGIFSLALLANKCEKIGDESAVYSGACENAVEVTTDNLTGLDGCSWVFTLPDSTRLEPINLDAYLQNPVEGEKVWVSLLPAKNMGSICMVGPLVEITCLEHQAED